MTLYYVSSRDMTFSVDVDVEGKIISTAPVVKKFIGQPFKNLEKMMLKQGRYKKKVIG